MKFLFLSVFGIIGVQLRYFFDVTFAADNKALPIATLSANTLGCAIAGVLVAFWLNKENNQIYNLLLIGFCGGLTTFSGYSLQFLKLIDSGEILRGFLFLFLSPILGIAVLLATYLLTKKYFLYL